MWRHDVSPIVIVVHRNRYRERCCRGVSHELQTDRSLDPEVIMCSSSDDSESGANSIADLDSCDATVSSAIASVQHLVQCEVQ